LYLKSIEIKGFKSFADKVEVEFTKGITAIVGPNGSGKSNICDAIRWVLGEQSAKTLRGSKMEDVIFSGTENRRPLNFAEVSLIIDNSDNILPIEYNEVKITRRLYRSGESEYLINNTACRLKDIYELLMDTGIGVDGYSIIGQGKVEEILSSKPEDRRLVFEEATGITKFKNRKIEAERKLENTRQNLTRINDIISELELQIEPLETQARKAEEYLKLKDELKFMEINSILYNYDIIKQKLDVTLREIENKVNELNALEINKENLNSRIYHKKNELASIQEQYDKTTNLSYELEKNIQKASSDIELFLERRENYINEKNRLESELASLKSTIEIENDKLCKLLKEKEHIDKKIIDQQELIKNIEAQLSEHIQEFKSKEKLIEDKKNELLEILNNISELKNKFSSLNFIKESLKKQYDNLIQMLESKEGKKSEIISYLTDKEKEQKELVLKIGNLKNEINNLNKLKLSIEKEIKDLDLKLVEIKQTLRTNEAKLNMLLEMEKELEGYNKAVKSLINEYKNEKGFLGTVSDILNVPNGYEVAIESALGSAFQNIVVKDEELAKVMIDYLKNNKLGRATFLPISTVKGKADIDKKQFEKFDGFIGIAAELVTFDPIYKNIVANLLGRTLICKTIDDAIELAKKTDFNFKIVTLDGEIVNPGGSLTGGLSSKNIGIFKRKNEIIKLKDDMEALNIKLKDIENNLNKKYQDKREIEISLEKLSSQINLANINMSTLNNEMKNIKNKLKEIDIEINDSKLEIEHVLNELEKVKNDECLYLSELNNKQNKKLELERQLEELNKIYFEFEASKENISSKLTSEKVIYAELKKECDVLNSKIKEAHLQQDKLENKKAEIESYLNDINNKIVEVEDNISIKKQKLEYLIKDLENNKKKENEYYNKKNLLSTEIMSLEDEINKVNKNISDLTSVIHKLEMTQSKQESEIGLLNQKLWDEYELTIPQAQKYKMDNFNNSDSNKKINSLKSRIKELGDVNLGAIEELKKVKERYEFLKEQREDLISAEQSLLDIIKDITEKMKIQFETNFATIRNYFNETFKELFGGGYADLRIDGENVLESGIEIIVQPPGKKLQNISLLSGGEKGLSAIALIFALLKFKPTPFCVLDEIEAALDDANVFRFANYLKNYSSKTQFILITHRKGSMSVADVLYGVTMEEKGVSKVLSLKLKEA